MYGDHERHETALKWHETEKSQQVLRTLLRPFKCIIYVLTKAKQETCIFISTV